MCDCMTVCAHIRACVSADLVRGGACNAAHISVCVIAGLVHQQQRMLCMLCMLCHLAMQYSTWHDANITVVRHNTNTGATQEE